MMYTVSNKSSKLVATRRGISQNYELRDSGKKDTYPEMSLPKPVFNTPPRKFHGHHNNHHNLKLHTNSSQECHSPQHEEIVKFVHDAWCTVADHAYDAPSSPDSAISVNSSSDRVHQLSNAIVTKSSSTSSSSSTASGGYAIPTLVYYTDNPDPRLHDFKPFDLEAWWGRQLYQTITRSL